MEPIRIYPTDGRGISILEDQQFFSEVLDGHHIIPAGFKLKQPPACQVREAARTLGPGRDADWEVIPDWEGYVYWTADRQRVVIDQVGVEPPEGHLTEDPGPTPTQRLAEIKGQARAALAEGDQVATRCVKFGVTYPQAWRDRDAALVSILNLPSGTDPDTITVPARPPYPEGTGWPD